MTWIRGPFAGEFHGAVHVNSSSSQLVLLVALGFTLNDTLKNEFVARRAAAKEADAAAQFDTDEPLVGRPCVCVCFWRCALYRILNSFPITIG